jgi:hypothetical protein
MVMSVNDARPAAGESLSAAESQLITAAGPLLTIVQALAGFVLVQRTGRRGFYALLFAALFMRLAAAFVSFWHPNDEARLSLAWGLGRWTLPALVVIGLLALAIGASRRLRLHWSANVLAYVVASIATTAVVFGGAALAR